jgi:hypothetical protein
MIFTVGLLSLVAAVIVFFFISWCLGNTKLTQSDMLPFGYLMMILIITGLIEIFISFLLLGWRYMP